MNRIAAAFKNGLIYQNPSFVLLLGMCPLLAISTTVKNGLGMGAAATAVLICSNVVISLLRKIVPAQIRIAAYIVIIAGFVTMVDLVIQAYAPTLYTALGIFIPLIVVNCIIFARAEAFASKNTVPHSALDGLTMGLGFTFALLAMSVIREVLGNGSFFDKPFDSSFQPAAIMTMAPGGFLTLGCLIALIQFLLSRRKKGV